MQKEELFARHTKIQQITANQCRSQNFRAFAGSFRISFMSRYAVVVTVYLCAIILKHSNLSVICGWAFVNPSRSQQMAIFNVNFFCVMVLLPSIWIQYRWFCNISLETSSYCFIKKISRRYATNIPSFARNYCRYYVIGYPMSIVHNKKILSCKYTYLLQLFSFTSPVSKTRC